MTSGWSSRELTRRSLLTGLGVGSVLAVAACTVGSPSSGTSTTTAPESSAPTPAGLTISIEDGAVDVSPARPLSVTAQPGSTLDSVEVTTAQGEPVEGHLDASAATWSPTQPLEYDTAYTVSAAASSIDDDQIAVTSTFSTVSPQAQIFPSIGPLDGTLAGIAMPVRVFFDHPVTDRAAVEQKLAVTPTPAQEGAWNWISDTEVHWRTKEYWLAGTHVQVDVDLYGVDAGDGAWGKVSRTISFDIGAHKVTVCDTATHQMHCYQDGQLVKSIPIAAGLEVPGRYTKNGIHVVTEKRAKMTMDSTTYGLALDAGGYQTPVEWATRISNNGEFIHAAPWSLADQGVRNVSHGCINASPANAKWHQDWCQIGDPVEVTGSPVPLTIDDGDIFDWTIDWQTWLQGSALD